MPSYPGVRARWPADQSATLASLHRYDVAHGARLSTEHARRYFTVVERSASKDGVPRSEVAQVTDSGRYPRGCALSFSVRYLAEVDPPRALALWQRYVAGYLVDGVLVTGFRKWPVGVERVPAPGYCAALAYPCRREAVQLRFLTPLPGLF